MANANRNIAAAALLLAVATTGCDQRETVGPGGGTVESADGRVTVEFAQGALGEETTVVVEEIDDCFSEALACYEVWPQGVMLSIPARITYELDSAREMDDMAVFGAHGDVWVRLPDRAIDHGAATVGASLRMLSDIAVVDGDARTFERDGDGG